MDASSVSERRGGGLEDLGVFSAVSGEAENDSEGDWSEFVHCRATYCTWKRALQVFNLPALLFSPGKLATRVVMGPVFHEAAHAAVLPGNAVFMVKGDQNSKGSRAVDTAPLCRFGASEAPRSSAVCFLIKTLSDQTQLCTEFLQFFKAAAKSKGDFLWVAVSYEAYTDTQERRPQMGKAPRQAEELARLLHENPNFAVLSREEMLHDNCLLPIREFARPYAEPYESVAAYFFS